jgi:hypothetical protein
MEGDLMASTKVGQVGPVLENPNWVTSLFSNTRFSWV